MKTQTYAQILDAAVAERIPTTVNLTQRILAQAGERKAVPMRPNMKLATIILLVVLGALALTSVGYALYRLFSDPGLQAVQDAGLLTTVEVSAQPTIYPTQTPILGTPQAVSDLALSQTLEGVTLTLDWVYLDEGRLALSMSFSDLPADVSLSAPAVTFKGVEPQQAWGYSQSLRTAPNRALYVSYQVIHADNIGGKVSLNVDVPLVQSGATMANFHFDVKDVPVYIGQTLPIQQTYAVKRNGVEVRLKAVRVMPSSSEVTVCYDFVRPDAPFSYMQRATLQLDNGPEEDYQTYQYLMEITDDHCVKLGFPLGSANGARRLVFRVQRLVVPLTMQDELPGERIAAANEALAQYGIEIKSARAAQSEGPGGWQFVRNPGESKDPTQSPSLLVLQALEEKMDGPWEFYVDIPSENLIPGQAAPTPTTTPAALGEQTIEDVSTTLDWVFADAKRAAFGYTIEGLPDTPDATNLSGTIVVKDQHGNLLGGPGGVIGTLQRVNGRPGVLQGTWSHVLEDALLQDELNLSIDITLDGSQGQQSDTIGYIYVEPSAQETPWPTGMFPPTLPDHLVGTFHFDAQTKIYPLTVLEPHQSTTANGINMRLERAEITPSYALFTLCYPKPSANDWMVGGPPTLRTGAYEATINSYSLLIDPDYGGYIGKGAPPSDLPQAAPGERCVQIDFLLGHSDATQSLTLTIPMLEQSTPEVVPDADIKAAQEKLRAQGIEMGYSSSASAGGGGGSGPLFTKKPEGMSDQQAYQAYMQALGYLYAGPWEFKLDMP